MDGRNLRRSLNQTGRYVRQPKDDPVSDALMEQHGVGYSSTGLVAQMREENNLWTQGEVKVKLAKAYGYCWGVERAVRMAYEAKNAFPNRKLFITNEIIHNPEVNQARAAPTPPWPAPQASLSLIFGHFWPFFWVRHDAAAAGEAQGLRPDRGRRRRHLPRLRRDRAGPSARRRCVSLRLAAAVAACLSVVQQ